MRVDVDGFDEVHHLTIGSAAVYVAVHRAAYGRAFGGIRVCPYPDDDAALEDACRLAVAMSRKVILTGLPAGGAKTVVRVPEAGWSPAERRTVLSGVGMFIADLGGRYHCGADLGFTAEDEDVVRSKTHHFASRDLGPWTSRSVLLAMRAFGEPSSVAIQGVGAVGRQVALELLAAGARVVVADTDQAAVEGLDGVETVAPDAIFDVECDVFAPCAAGAVLTEETVARLQCRMVCGGANNPLASDSVADLLRERGIRYVPDVLANAGAVIKGAATALDRRDDVEALLAAIPDRVRELVGAAETADRSPHHLANERADALLILAQVR